MHPGETIPPTSFKIRKEMMDMISYWEDVTTDDMFKGKRVVLFAVPGAHTPVCSAKQLPDFENNYDRMKELGIDEVYCVSVNDSFVMNNWFNTRRVSKVKTIPDGNGDFTKNMGMLVEKRNLGYGNRSWRYAAVVNDCVIEHWLEEPGRADNTEEDPYDVSTADNIIDYLESLS